MAYPRPPLDPSGPSYSGAGIKTSVSGTVYQIELLILVMNRGLSAGCTFNVATEVASAEAFDDLVFIYGNRTGTINGVLFLQAKHRTNVGNKIRDIDLTGVVNGDFYVPKYFESYRRIITKRKKEFKGDMKHFFIYTPIDIDDDILQDNFEEVPSSHVFAENDFLCFNSILLPERQPGNHPKFLKIRKDKKSDFYVNIVQLLRKNTERLIVAEKLGKMISAKSKITVEEVLKKHRDWLLEKVFDRDEKTKENRKVYIKFKESFLKIENTEKDIELLEFRKILLQTYAETQYQENTNKENDNKDEVREKKNIIDILIEQNANIEVPETYLTSKFKKLQLNDTTNTEIESFLDKFIFATNQPNNDELKKIIQIEIGEMMNLVSDDSQWVENRLQSCVLDWLRAEKAHYVTNDNCKAFFEYVRQKFAASSQTSLSFGNVTQIEECGYTFSTGNLMKAIEDFLGGVGDPQMLCVYYTNKLLTQIKLCQIIGSYRDKKLNIIFGELKKLSRHMGSKMCPIKAFTSHLINHVLLEINNCFNLCSEEKELLQEIIGIVKNDTKKRLVVMIAKDQQTPWENILGSCNNKKLSDSEYKFSDLSEESKDKLSKTATVRFSGRKFSLGTLLDKTLIDRLGGDALSALINDNLDLGSAVADVLYTSVKAYYIDRRFSQRNEIKMNFTLDVYKYMTPMDVILQNNPDKIIMVNAAPGMGKSTLLSNLETKINQYPEYFCIRTSLVDHCEYFEDLKEDDMKEESIKFLYKISSLPGKDYEDDICEHVFVLDNGDLKLNTSSRATFDELLRVAIFCDVYNGGNIVLLLDAFDEISPLYNTKVIRLIQTLKVMKVSKIMITSRPYDTVSELEDSCSFPYTLEPLSVEEQRDLFFRYWAVKLKDNKVAFSTTEVTEFLDLLNRTLFKQLQQHDDNYMSIFLSIPLHVYMLAVVEEKRFQEFLTKKENINIDNWCTLFSIYTLYYEFFKRKFYDILYSETDVKVPKNNRMLRNKMKETMIDNGKLALLELFSDVPGPLVSEDDRKRLKEEVKIGEEKTGFVHIVNGEPRFVHGTYAEFFAAEILADVILNSQRDKAEAEKFLYKIITEYSWRSSVILAFFNYKVVSNSRHCSLFNSALNGHVQQVTAVENIADIQDDLGRTPFHLLFCSGLVYEGVMNIYKNHRSAMYVPDNLFKWSPVHYAVVRHSCNQTFPSSGHQFVAKSREPEFRDINGRTPLILATQGRCRRSCVFNYIYDFSLEIDAQDNTGKTALHYAVINRKELAFVCIVHLRADLDAQDCEGKTALHYAIEKRRVDAANNLIAMGADVAIRDNNEKIPAYFEMNELLRVNRKVCPTLSFINKLEPVVLKYLVEYMELSQNVPVQTLRPYKNIYRYILSREKLRIRPHQASLELNRYRGLFLKRNDANVTVNDNTNDSVNDNGNGTINDTKIRQVEINLTICLDVIIANYKLWKRSEMDRKRKYTRF